MMIGSEELELEGGKGREKELRDRLEKNRLEWELVSSDGNRRDVSEHDTRWQRIFAELGAQGRGARSRRKRACPHLSSIASLLSTSKKVDSSQTRNQLLELSQYPRSTIEGLQPQITVLKVTHYLTPLLSWISPPPDSQNSPYLSPSFFLPSHSNSYGEGSSTQDDFSNLLSPSSSELDPLSQFSLLLEAESDLRSLEKQLSECQSLDDRKVLESGKLADHFDLIPKLRQLREESTAKDTELRGMEIRMQNLCNEYGQWVSVETEGRKEVLNVMSWSDLSFISFSFVLSLTMKVDSVSKLFIIFDRALNDMELKVAQKERERDRRAGTLDEDKKEEGRRWNREVWKSSNVIMFIRNRKKTKHKLGREVNFRWVIQGSSSFKNWKAKKRIKGCKGRGRNVLKSYKIRNERAQVKIDIPMETRMAKLEL